MSHNDRESNHKDHKKHKWQGLQIPRKPDDLHNDPKKANLYNMYKSAYQEDITNMLKEIDKVFD